MKEHKAFQVNYLLSMARLPVHFYAILNGLKGRDVTYANPGISLQSFVIAKCISRETVSLSGEMLIAVRECEKFSQSAETFAKITEMLMTHSTGVITKVMSLDPAYQLSMTEDITNLDNMSKVTKLCFDSFIMSQDPAEDKVDVLSQLGINLKQALFDLQGMIEDISYKIEQIPDSNPPATA